MFLRHLVGSLGINNIIAMSNKDTGKDTDMDTEMDMDMDLELAQELFCTVRYPDGTVVPFVLYGLPETDHGAISSSTVNFYHCFLVRIFILQLEEQPIENCSKGSDPRHKFVGRAMVPSWPVHHPAESCQKVLRAFHRGHLVFFQVKLPKILA